MTVRAVDESSPEVGSSTKRSDGLVTSSTPMLTRFLSPPLMPPRSGSPTMVSEAFSSRNCRSTSSTTFFLSLDEVPLPRRMRALNISISRTVCVCMTRSSCVMYAASVRIARSHAPHSWPL